MPVQTVRFRRYLFALSFAVAANGQVMIDTIAGTKPQNGIPAAQAVIFPSALVSDASGG
jgi:hypothetical protein